MPKVAAIVQARIRSWRCMGKVLERIGATTVLEEVLRRCRAVPRIDIVVCAVPDRIEDDIVAEEARRCGAVVIRGSENDVLDRYYKAALHVESDVILRVTSDCPLIDPEICDRVVGFLFDLDVDYVTNNFPQSWPHGLDCEAFTFEVLKRAHRSASEPRDREHVVPWFRRTPSIRHFNYDGPGGDLVNHRWTIDYPEDLEFMRTLFEHLPAPPVIPAWGEVIEILKDNPDMMEINRMHGIHG